MAFSRVLLATAAIVRSAAGAEVNPAFEVATVKVSGPDITTRHFTIEGRRFLTFHTSLADLIQFAYGLHPRQLAGGPGWLESTRFDVVGLASSERQPTEPEWMKMMANLVTERFHLRFHLEKRELAVYALTADPGGSKLESTGHRPAAAAEAPHTGRRRRTTARPSRLKRYFTLSNVMFD